MTTSKNKKKWISSVKVCKCVHPQQIDVQYTQFSNHLAVCELSHYALPGSEHRSTVLTDLRDQGSNMNKYKD